MGRSSQWVPISGVRNFNGERLQVLQIGLGTFGTFLHNNISPDDYDPVVNWLLDAASDSTSTIRGVGVEPAPEHATKLLPALEILPNVALVQAAIGSGCHGRRWAASGKNARTCRGFASQLQCRNKTI